MASCCSRSPHSSAVVCSSGKPSCARCRRARRIFRRGGRSAPTVALPSSALLIPSLLSAVVGAATVLVVAVALSSVFPVGTARDYELHPGTHADWLVLAVAMLTVVAAVLIVAAVAAWWRASRRARGDTRPSLIDKVVAPMSHAPALMIGARLAGEPGRGRRAVPVRSALVGAVAGVLGVVGCLTFRAGLEDAVNQPRRSGVVWDFGLAAGGGVVPHSTRPRRRPGHRRSGLAARDVVPSDPRERPPDPDVRHAHGDRRHPVRRAPRSSTAARRTRSRSRPPRCGN